MLPGPLISIVLIKKPLFSHVNNVAWEVFNFEKLNFSKTTVAYWTFQWYFLHLKLSRSLLTENVDYIWKQKLTENFWVKRNFFFFQKIPKTSKKPSWAFFHQNHLNEVLEVLQLGSIRWSFIPNLIWWLCLPLAKYAYGMAKYSFQLVPNQQILKVSFSGIVEFYDYWILQNRLHLEHFSVKCTLYDMKHWIVPKQYIR